MLKPKSNPQSSPAISASKSGVSSNNSSSSKGMKTGEKFAPAKPAKRLSIQTSKDKNAPKWEDVASFWEQKSKTGNTYYSGKSADGTKYYIFSDKEGNLSLATKNSEGKFDKIADFKPNKKGTLGAEVESGYLLLRDAGPSVGTQASTSSSN